MSDGSDFDDDMYTVTFVVGPLPMTQCASISTTEDEVLEGDHDFTVSLVSITPDDVAEIVTQSTHTVTINDDDGMY